MNSKVVYNNYTLYENGEIYNKHNKLLRYSDNGKGYLIIRLMDGSKRITKAAHRLIAESFIDNPNNLADVDHIDGDRRNNCKSNLRWVSHGENIRHSYELNNRSASGCVNANCKTTKDIVMRIATLLSDGVSSCCIRDLGYDYNLIRAIKSRKNWSKFTKDYSW